MDDAKLKRVYRLRWLFAKAFMIDGECRLFLLLTDASVKNLTTQREFTMSENAQRSPVAVWMQAVRAFSFTASVVPVLVGAALALRIPVDHPWSLMPLIIICALLMHAATNLISDYYDFKKGVDKKETYGSSRVLVDELLSPQQVLRAGLLLFTAAFILGLSLVAVRGVPILVLGLVGIAGGYFYCGGGPFAYKYLAIGDPFVFMLMGPLMVCGAFFVLTGEMNVEIFNASLPIGCLVAAILVANNIRDIVHDRAAHTRTVATLLGAGGAKLEYAGLVIGAYVIVIVLVLMHTIGVWSLLVLLSLPPAIKNLKAIMQSDPENDPQTIAMADVQTAQHHFLFGLLYTIGLAISHWQ